jgi:hypothetical protein
VVVEEVAEEVAWVAVDLSEEEALVVAPHLVQEVHLQDKVLQLEDHQ